MRVVERWWNGRWGRLSRRDVFLREDDGRWEVEAREGGADGRSNIHPCVDEAEAREWLTVCLHDKLGGWQQLPIGRG